jgi:threonine dehydratase
MQKENPLVNLESIRAAGSRINDKIYRSPCPYSLSLSRICGSEIYCKLDHLQLTGSFKERGARNKLKLLTDAERKCGVIAVSAGNHGLGLAYHGRDLGIPVTVIMPRWAPLVKVTNCRSFGANVILHGESYDDAKKHALEMAEQRKLTYVPGFDDPAVISGQGTMGLEILEDVPDVDVVIVPVGGGGLIAGVGAAIKALRPQVRIIGVEAVNAPTMHESLRQGKVVRIPTKPTLADGLAIAEAGKLCLEIAKQVVDQIVLVSEEQIARSILRLLEHEKTVVEGAAAVPLAAAMDKSLALDGKKVVLCLCGGNIDVHLIARVIERGLAADGRLCRITAYISERPGSLAKLLSVIAETGASIKDISQDRNFAPGDVALVAACCIIETRDFAHIGEIHAALHAAGINFNA